MEDSTKFILCCVAATAVTFTMAFAGIVSLTLVGVATLVVVAGGAVLTGSSSQRLVVGMIGALGVLTAGAVVPLGLEEVAMRWDLSEELFVSLVLIGVAVTLGTSLEVIRRRMADAARIDSETR